MSATKCPHCQATLNTDDADDAGLLRCKGCGQELELKRSSKKKKRSGVMVEGRVFGTGNREDEKAASGKKPRPAPPRLAPRPGAAPLQGQPPPSPQPHAAPPPGYPPYPGYPPSPYPQVDQYGRPLPGAPPYYPPPYPPQQPWPGQAAPEGYQQAPAYPNWPGYYPPGYAPPPVSPAGLPPSGVEAEAEPAAPPAPAPLAERTSGRPPLPVVTAPGYPPPAARSLPVVKEEDEDESEGEEVAEAFQPRQTTRLSRAEAEEDAETEWEDEEELTPVKRDHLIAARRKRIRQLAVALILLVVAIVAVVVLDQQGGLKGLQAQAKAEPAPQANSAATKLAAVPKGQPVEPEAAQPTIRIPKNMSINQALEGHDSPDRFYISHEVAENFLKAKTLEERVKLVRNQSQDLPHMQRYYEKHPDEVYEFSNIDVIPIETINPQYCGFRITMLDGAVRLLGLERTVDGYRVDWPSWVVYSEMDFEEMREKRPELPVLCRVFAVTDDYYNYDFADARRFHCYRLETPNSNALPLYGYVDKQSPMASEMARIQELARGGKLPLVVRLAYPAKSKNPNQVWITDLVSNGWMIRGDQEKKKALE